jgi:hypothetical protein
MSLEQIQKAGRSSAREEELQLDNACDAQRNGGKVVAQPRLAVGIAVRVAQWLVVSTHAKTRQQQKQSKAEKRFSLS